MKKYILLTFDIEEFDLPFKYGVKINEREMYNISREGTDNLLALLEKYEIKATFFITALFAKKYPFLIRELGKKHEIGLHGYAHSDSYEELSKKETVARLKKAKDILEKISNKKIVSFRAQRLQKIDCSLLRKVGLEVDSSILPTFIPLSLTYTLGRIENLFKSRKIFSEKGVTEIPLTVTPIVRLPLLWITFRNMPMIYAKTCTKWALINNNFVNLVFHPWEFIDIRRLKIPFLIKNNTGDKFSKKIENYIRWAKKRGYEFSTMRDFLSNKKLSGKVS